MKVTNLASSARPMVFLTKTIGIDRESHHRLSRVARERPSHERRQWTALRALTQITSLGAFSTI